MTISYDVEVDALHIVFIETTVTSAPVAPGITVDYAADGRLAGIEILDAKKLFGSANPLQRVTLEGVGIGLPA
jgi:uncharacterized protein YuzE